MQIDDVVGYIK